MQEKNSDRLRRELNEIIHQVNEFTGDVALAERYLAIGQEKLRYWRIVTANVLGANGRNGILGAANPIKLLPIVRNWNWN
ncbi:MAG: hypothetical protein RR387_08200 [Clostridiales bacterium]